MLPPGFSVKKNKAGNSVISHNGRDPCSVLTEKDGNPAITITGTLETLVLHRQGQEPEPVKSPFPREDKAGYIPQMITGEYDRWYNTPLTP
jgi:hypothetical protein